MSHDWGYDSNNGPWTWAKEYPVADGPRQSPINIVPEEVAFDPTLLPLKLRYNPDDAKAILNNGHSFQVDFRDEGESSTLSGGPLCGAYRLRQLHGHWGCSDDHGSEHTLRGCSFPAELHLVHWNSRYHSFDEAKSQADGLAVIGVFLERGQASTSLQQVLDTFKSIRTKGKQTTFNNFDARSLLPVSLEYWTYEGSLTTPPLLESVTWVVLKQTTSVSSAQMKAFRKLMFSSEEETHSNMVDNYRPPQPLKGRLVRANFQVLESTQAKHMLHGLPVTCLIVLEEKIKSLKSSIKKYALLSVAGAAVPIPGVSFCADIALIVGFVVKCQRSLGLTEGALWRLSEATDVSVEQLRKELKSLFTGVEITKELVVTYLKWYVSAVARFALAGASRFIPVVGIPVSMALSYVTVCSVLNSLLRLMTEDARRVFDLSFY